MAVQARHSELYDIELIRNWAPPNGFYFFPFGFSLQLWFKDRRNGALRRTIAAFRISR